MKLESNELGLIWVELELVDWKAAESALELHLGKECFFIP